MRAIYICTCCFDTRPTKVGAQIICSNCGHIEKVKDYRELLNEIRFIVRYAYQYRLKLEQDYKKDPSLSIRYYLHELNKIFEFLGLAVISGVAGNYAYDKIKVILRNIAENPLIIKIKDKDFQKLLQDEKEMETFIRYIEEYRKKQFSTDRKILEAIFDEETAHKRVEDFLLSSRGKAFIKNLNKKDKSPTSKKSKKK